MAVLAVSVWPSLDPLTTAAVVERLFRVVTHLNSTAVKLCILTYSTRIEAASLSLSVHQYSAAFLALEVVAVVAPAALTHHLQGVDVALVPNTVPTLAVLVRTCILIMCSAL